MSELVETAFGGKIRRLYSGSHNSLFIGHTNNPPDGVRSQLTILGDPCNFPEAYDLSDGHHFGRDIKIDSVHGFGMISISYKNELSGTDDPVEVFGEAENLHTIGDETIYAVPVYINLNKRGFYNSNHYLIWRRKN